MANGGLPVLLFGQCGSMICTSAFQGTTRSISSRNSRLRVFFVDKFRPRLICFMAWIFAAQAGPGNEGPSGVLQTFPRRAHEAHAHPTIGQTKYSNLASC